MACTKRSYAQQHETPLQAVGLLATVTEHLTTQQKVFVYETVERYLKASAFDCDLSAISRLLKSQIERLKEQAEDNKPLTGSIRETLKQLMQHEIETLPETLKELEPVQRLNILCKLIPFVLPKVESINHGLGEPEVTGFNRFIP